MANDYGYFGSGSTGMLIISKPLTVTLVVLVAAVEDTDLRSGIMVITMVVVIILVVEFCC